MDKIRPPEKLTSEWCINYSNKRPTLVRGFFPSNYIEPELDDLFYRLKNLDYLNYEVARIWYTERYYYLLALSERDDITETHKRLIKMYQSKL